MKAPIRLLAAFLILSTTACGKNESPFNGSSSDDDQEAFIANWVQTIGTPSQDLYIRPPGQVYGNGDGSSWENAFAGLPETRVRGARYFFAAGDYFDQSLGRVENFVLDDAVQGELFIWLVKATARNHGSDAGFTQALAEGPAMLGPLAFITGRYIIDGQTGSGMEGFGFEISHRNCDLRANNFIASPIFFPWNSETQYLLIEHTDIKDCGSHDDPTTRSQDAIYAVNPVSHVVFRQNYIHDSWRNHLFLQDAFDVMIEQNYFARAGLHHEANSLAFRNTRNVVVRRNYITDSQNCFISMQDVRNVTISANILTKTLDDWDNWAGICSEFPAMNVKIIGNTFFGLEGLNVGIRFTSDVENLIVHNNIWANNDANQIMLNGEHSHNAFWNNRRVDGAEPMSIDGNHDEPTAQFFTANPFVDSANFDFRLTAHTTPGLRLNLPYINEDFNGIPRGATPDRGAFQFVAP
ncbi:MAG: right-handed parallel beta-helix repeat-containing protein [Deltaproteobacteria bacterium]|nr:right-handed parallel beta-helix repeat-containing protein [Deltaproteobacteria bacterium]